MMPCVNCCFVDKLQSKSKISSIWNMFDRNFFQCRNKIFSSLYMHIFILNFYPGYCTSISTFCYYCLFLLQIILNEEVVNNKHRHTFAKFIQPIHYARFTSKRFQILIVHSSDSYYKDLLNNILLCIPL